MPMHVVGLLGMPRRNYTYPAGMGWTGLNLVETLGAYLLTCGLLLMTANLLVSAFRGAPAGEDPWDGDTLEWAISSPPPVYNFAVVPKITSAYPMWDDADRLEDMRRLARGEMVLAEGHQQPTSTPLDAELDEVLEMPTESVWPLLVALPLAGVFAMLLTGHVSTAYVFAGLALVLLGTWHLKEPHEA
jgi:cytochrome c oxidase subunit 1/cytochrome c oxidase subunit I+III